MEELENEIRELQAQMEVAIEVNDVTQAHWLEGEIDKLQDKLLRLKRGQHE